MPELPEVETIKIALQSKLTGLSIKRIDVLNAKSFSGQGQQILKAKITMVWRRAKVLGMDFENGLSLIFHLKMSGQIIWTKGGPDRAVNDQKVIGGHPTKDMFGEVPNKSTRVIFELSDKSKLYFNDQRKFGWVRVVKSQDLKSINYGLVKSLGPEPLENDFTWEVLKERLQRHKKIAVKVSLLDQGVVSGVGNIYACEACFIANIHPAQKVETLNDQQIQKLHWGIVQSLKDGIKYGGSSKVHFVNPEGKRGYFLDYAFVYDRSGQSCRICQATVEKIKLTGRGTYFCPNCQKIFR